jgi:hypothetical protein
MDSPVIAVKIYAYLRQTLGRADWFQRSTHQDCAERGKIILNDRFPDAIPRGSADRDAFTT